MRCSFEETVDILVEAAIHCEIDPVKGGPIYLFTLLFYVMSAGYKTIMVAMRSGNEKHQITLPTASTNIITITIS
uniref:Uncharacterized protein n=1 Tax=Ditylenchus dipsaci TaxID=166011 RepID=A0A915EQ46_9BILA